MICLFLCVTVFGASTRAVEENVWDYSQYEEYVSLEGDYFVADLENGMGFLVNEEEKQFTFFPLLSGQRRNVCYIGRCYYGATPEQEWIAKEESIQGDRITFSETGEFLRLFEDEGEKKTSYGIHGHANFDEMLATGEKFKSMGCIIVADEVLDVVEESFIANSEELRVITKSEVDISFLFLLLV